MPEYQIRMVVTWELACELQAALSERRDSLTRLRRDLAARDPEAVVKIDTWLADLETLRRTFEGAYNEARRRAAAEQAKG